VFEELPPVLEVEVVNHVDEEQGHLRLVGRAAVQVFVLRGHVGSGLKPLPPGVD
jgi:hypothetical protein